MFLPLYVMLKTRISVLRQQVCWTALRCSFSKSSRKGMGELQPESGRDNNHKTSDAQAACIIHAP